MAKKSKKKRGGFLNLVSTLIIVALVVVGLVCFVSVDANGGVTLAATTTIGNMVGGVGFVFYGLASVFGGEATLGSYAIVNGEAKDPTESPIGINLNANYGVIVGLILVAVATILILLLRKNKVGMLVSTLLLLGGSILLLCGGQFFSMVNQDTIGGLTSGKFGDIAYLDIGSLTAGVFGLGASLLAIIQSIVVAIRR